jgi:hypothetical protein
MYKLAPLLLLAVLAGTAHAQYNPTAAQNAPRAAPVAEDYVKEDGSKGRREVMKPVQTDRYGNASGNKFDLAVDGAFKGQTVAVLQFYTMENFDFSLPKAALAEKGFSVYRWIGAPPSAKELRAKLKLASQLWIIAGDQQLLGPDHLKVIKEFFDSGKGVYIWGDNEPYYADANAVAEVLFGGKMTGNLIGDQVVGMASHGKQTGVVVGHLLTTGLEFLYEGITIATIQPNQMLKPLIYGHEGNLVAAYYDANGKRAILDGGFTRLYVKWDTAGTARYVKNAAAWLQNVERFGAAVYVKASR